ncbi:unnamed protein product, partial [Discosporangium mesarthrocarpum]
GSLSAVKLEAVREAFELVFPTREVLILGMPTASGVPDQPVGNEETKTGAVNRARAASQTYALDHDGAKPSFAVGLEGGVDLETVPRQEEESNSSTRKTVMYCFAWMAILSDRGKWGLSRTGSFAVHPAVADAVSNQRLELGHACDLVFNATSGKGHSGLVGMATAGLISRKSFYAHALVLAISPNFDQATWL